MKFSWVLAIALAVATFVTWVYGELGTVYGRPCGPFVWAASFVLLALFGLALYRLLDAEL